MAYSLRSRLVGGLLAAVAIGGLAWTPAFAETLVFAAGNDASTMDPHSNLTTPSTQLQRQVYEPLVGRDQELKVIPMLAESWEQTEPTRWRFKLRPNVKFHDGAALTADDVIFSLKRVAAPTSHFRPAVDTVTAVEKVDDLTFDIVTSEPDLVLLSKLTNVAIMNKAWSEANNAALPQDMSKQEEAFTSRHSNGTGPYMLESRVPNVETVLVVNPNYWGEITGNVTKYVSKPIAAAATRVAALLSGEVNFVLDAPLQDIERLKATDGITTSGGPELRTMFLTLNNEKEHLTGDNPPDKNPLRDQRVRKALYQAIDIDAIQSKIMRGYAVPTAIFFPPSVHGFPADLDVRYPYDVEAAKSLLKEAGYPDGFSFTLDCTANRYVNDEQLCQALVAMWAKVGVKVTPAPVPIAQFVQKITTRGQSDMFMQAAATTTLDAFYSLQAWVLSPTGRSGDGQWNLGGYKNDEIDKAILAIRSELDDTKRTELIHKAVELWKQDVVQIPLFHPVSTWAMRSNVDAKYRSDNQLEAKWVTIK